jgi:hypothetical protein
VIPAVIPSGTKSGCKEAVKALTTRHHPAQPRLDRLRARQRGQLGERAVRIEPMKSSQDDLAFCAPLHTHSGIGEDAPQYPLKLIDEQPSGSLLDLNEALSNARIERELGQPTGAIHPFAICPRHSRRQLASRKVLLELAHHIIGCRDGSDQNLSRMARLDRLALARLNLGGHGDDACLASGLDLRGVPTVAVANSTTANGTQAPLTRCLGASSALGARWVLSHQPIPIFRSDES